MIIGLDIDDTICNTKELQSIYWKEYYNNNKTDEFSEELPKEVNYFGIDYVDGFWDTYRAKLFRPNIKDDLLDVINEFRGKGFKFYIVTSRPDENYVNLKKDISDWFNDIGLEVDGIYTNVREKALFCKNNNIDMLIDDDIRHISKCDELDVSYIHFDDDMTWLKVREILNNYL